MKLESSHDNFERNKLDEFRLDLGQLDLGEVKEIEIGFATQQTLAGKMGGMFGQQWFLGSVEVRSALCVLRIVEGGGGGGGAMARRAHACVAPWAAQAGVQTGLLRFGLCRCVPGTSTTGLMCVRWASCVNSCSLPQVVHFNTTARAYFLYEDWINDKKRRVRLVPGQVRWTREPALRQG